MNKMRIIPEYNGVGSCSALGGTVHYQDIISIYGESYIPMPME